MLPGYPPGCISMGTGWTNSAVLPSLHLHISSAEQCNYLLFRSKRVGGGQQLACLHLHRSTVACSRGPLSRKASPSLLTSCHSVCGILTFPMNLIYLLSRYICAPQGSSCQNAYEWEENVRIVLKYRGALPPWHFLKLNTRQKMSLQKFKVKPS